jgi:hypothetical protein
MWKGLGFTGRRAVGGRAELFQNMGFEGKKKPTYDLSPQKS